MVDWQTFWTTFGLVFLAELGDKTQLATLSMASAGRGRWTVFAGSALALVVASGVAVLAGAAAERWLPRAWVRTAAGVFFLGAGVWLLLGRNGP